MKRIFIYTNGCERRKLDAARFRDYFLSNNCMIVDRPSKADIILFITCAVLDRPTEDSLNKIKRFKRFNANLIVGGCLPDIEPVALREIFDGVVIPTSSLNNNPSYIDEIFSKYGFKISFSEIKDPNTPFETAYHNLPLPVERIFDTLKKSLIKRILPEELIIYRFLVKEDLFLLRTGWGCHGKCSYCAINRAVGRLQSKPIDECIEEFRRGLERGYRHFILTADNVGAYGIDRGLTLPNLLDRLLSIDGDYDLSIINLHPVWAVKYWEEIKKNLDKMYIIDIPVQSGSERILKLMRRFHDVQRILNLLRDIKQASGGRVKLGTDIIIGFPSESEEELKETLKFVTNAGIDLGTAIKFSCKKGTEAESIEPKVDDREIERRFRYAKKYFKRNGYSVIHFPKLHYFIFYRRE